MLLLYLAVRDALLPLWVGGTEKHPAVSGTSALRFPAASLGREHQGAVIGRANGSAGLRKRSSGAAGTGRPEANPWITSAGEQASEMGPS